MMEFLVKHRRGGYTSFLYKYIDDYLMDIGYYHATKPLLRPQSLTIIVGNSTYNAVIGGYLTPEFGEIFNIVSSLPEEQRAFDNAKRIRIDDMDGHSGISVYIELEAPD